MSSIPIYMNIATFLETVQRPHLSDAQRFALRMQATQLFATLSDEQQRKEFVQRTINLYQ